MNDYQPDLLRAPARGFWRSVSGFVGAVLLGAIVAGCAPSAASGPVASVQNGVSAVVTRAAPAARPASPAPAATAASGSTSGQAAETRPTSRLNLNTATSEELLKVPGVGSRMLREFQEYKPYASIEQFRREIGKYVDDKTVAGYEQYVYVPISVNSADAATLQQIAGLDAGEAARLIAGRPYASNDAFLRKLAEYVSPGELAETASMLSNS